MLKREKIAIDITNQNIKVLVGNVESVKYCGLIKTPEGSFSDDKIINVTALSEAIGRFLRRKAVKVDNVDFVIRGQDIVTRIIETPVMDQKGIRKTLEWETAQFLPQGGENYYIDFEILDKVVEKSKKVYKMLVVAVLKDKIDRYMELSKKLNLNLHAIDISSNCITRTFKEVSRRSDKIESVGIINIGNEASSIIILNNGKFFIEREVPFGMNNIYKEVVRQKEVPMEQAEETFIKSFNFGTINKENELDSRVESLFNNVFSSFDKIIQFYSTGKTKKTLDEIYVIGEGAKVEGIDNFIKNSFSAPTSSVEYAKDIKIKTKIPSECEFKLYINALGLLLRKE